MQKYLEAINNGQYITISGGDYTPAIFWKSGENIYTFSPVFGSMKRKDFTAKKAARHFLKMEKEGLTVIISGHVD